MALVPLEYIFKTFWDKNISINTMAATTEVTAPEAMPQQITPSLSKASYIQVGQLTVGVQQAHNLYADKSNQTMDQRTITDYYAQPRLTQTITFDKSKTKYSQLFNAAFTLSSIKNHTTIGMHGDFLKGNTGLDWEMVKLTFRLHSAVTHQGAIVCRALPFTVAGMYDMWSDIMPDMLVADYKAKDGYIFQTNSLLVNLGSEPGSGSAIKEWDVCIWNNSGFAHCVEANAAYPIGEVEIVVWDVLNSQAGTISSAQLQVFESWHGVRFGRPAWDDKILN